MNTNLMLDEQPRAQDEETQKMVEAVKSCLQTSLAGEAQNFRSWVAGSHRKFRELQRWALLTTALACVSSFLILAAGIWQAHRIVRQAAAQSQLMQNSATAGADPFANLRQANWKPAGKLITQNGHTFTELKPAN
jgi:hypothetical protein